MKLSEARPCASCQGPLVKPPAGMWYVVRVTEAMVSPRAAQGVLGTATLLGGLGNPGALAVAEALAPAANDAIVILGDKEPALMTELHVCCDCYTMGKLDLAALVERANESTPG